jgi:hypothetical protein
MIGTIWYREEEERVLVFKEGEVGNSDGDAVPSFHGW